MDSLNPYAPPAVPAVPPTDDIARQLLGLQYPLALTFKILALARQATVTDAAGRTVLYTRQKLLKFREHVEILSLGASASSTRRPNGACMKTMRRALGSGPGRRSKIWSCSFSTKVLRIAAKSSGRVLAKSRSR